MLKQEMSLPPRKDSFTGIFGNFNDDLLASFGLSHTPPTLSTSMDAPMKRNRTGSISGRLRSASDLEDKGFIDRYQKGILKDLIISGDEQLLGALDAYEDGDPSELEALVAHGMLQNRKSSLDLLDELDLNFLSVGSLEETNSPRDNAYDAQFARDSQYLSGGLSEFDEINFAPGELRFSDESSDTLDILGGKGKRLGDGSRVSFDSKGLASSLPTVGMGVTPPHPFNFSDHYIPYKVENLSADKKKAEAGPSSAQTDNKTLNRTPSPAIPGAARPTSGATVNSTTSGVKTVSAPIVIPGSSSTTASDDLAKRFVGAYSPESRRKRIEKFLEKRKHRVWTKKVKYDVRKNFADSRLRVKGRFVRKEDEELLRELLSLTVGGYLLSVDGDGAET